MAALALTGILAPVIGNLLNTIISKKAHNNKTSTYTRTPQKAKRYKKARSGARRLSPANHYKTAKYSHPWPTSVSTANRKERIERLL